MPVLFGDSEFLHYFLWGHYSIRYLTYNVMKFYARANQQGNCN